jgi:hypothetical protein
LLESADQRIELACALGAQTLARGGEEALVHAVGIGRLEIVGTLL